MFDTNKNYWLYIAPYVYCCIKEKHALLYNTQTGATIESDTREILALLRSLHEKKNMGAVRCEGKKMLQEPYHKFVIEFYEKGMGNWTDTARMPDRPIQLMPVLNLQHDVDKLQKEKERHTGENVLRYLLELNLCLHTACEQNCLFCNDYFRQSLCCHRTKHGTQREVLNPTILQNILSQIRYGVVGKINLLGGNLLKYPYYKELPSLFADFKERVHLWNHYTNFILCETAMPDFFYDVPVTFPVKKTTWEHCLTLLNKQQSKYHFFITGIEEYEKAENLIEKYGINNYAIHPVYTKNNLAFFEESVYSDREDIFQAKLSFRQIFAHQKLNTFFFGSLTVLANGEVKANVNSSVLGNIFRDTLLDIIHKEMHTNTAWRKIRNIAPCSDCLYQYLCPSPSNYEFAIGKPNLCHIKK
jgi:pseudo-rSAM protein